MLKESTNFYVKEAEKKGNNWSYGLAYFEKFK